MEFLWIILVVMRVMIANGIFPYLRKRVLNEDAAWVKVFVLQFVFALPIAIFVAVMTGQLEWSVRTLPITLMAFANCFGAYFQWRAVALSVSKTALFTTLDDVIPLVLGFYLLNERKLFNPLLGLGVLLSFVAVAIFMREDYRRKRKNEEKAATGKVVMGKLVLFIVAYSVPFGLNNFLMRKWSLELAGVSPLTFVSSWYPGTVVAAVTILFLAKKHYVLADYNNRKIAKRSGYVAALFGCMHVVNMSLAFWIASLRPIIGIQPIYLISEIIVPSIIGLRIFGEWEQMSRSDCFAFGLAVVAGVIVALAI